MCALTCYVTRIFQHSLQVYHALLPGSAVPMGLLVLLGFNVFYTIIPAVVSVFEVSSINSDYVQCNYTPMHEFLMQTIKPHSMEMGSHYYLHQYLSENAASMKNSKYF